jgi:hypothetical protein
MSRINITIGLEEGNAIPRIDPQTTEIGASPIFSRPVFLYLSKTVGPELAEGGYDVRDKSGEPRLAPFEHRPCRRSHGREAP